MEITHLCGSLKIEFWDGIYIKIIKKTTTMSEYGHHMDLIVEVHVTCVYSATHAHTRKSNKYSNHEG